MATEAQIIANHANAQLSTGPRTAEGKQASAANSTVTGLAAAKIFVRPGEEANFAQLESNLRHEIKPAGTLEEELFHRALHASWNLRRCAEIEAKIQEEAFAKGLIDAIEDDELARKLDRVYRYRKTHESAQRRALADLRQLQTEALWRRQNKTSLNESVLANAARVNRQSHSRKVADERASFEAFCQNLEAFTAPPKLPGLGV